jgi:hypothetical protein
VSLVKALLSSTSLVGAGEIDDPSTHFPHMFLATSEIPAGGNMNDQSQSDDVSKPVIVIDHPHSEWYYDSNGDLEILSSDGVLMRLAAFRLQASS